MVTDDEIQKIVVQNPDIRDACTKLIARANEHGGEDNVTAVLIKIEDHLDAPTEESPAARAKREATTDPADETTSPGPGGVRSK